MKKSQILKQYKMMKNYRKNNLAPVDTMGADCHFDKNSKDIEEEKFTLLLSLLCSVQTNDKITDRMIKNYKKEKLTRKKLELKEEEEIKDIISIVNFNSKKAKYIKTFLNEYKNKKMPDK